MKRLQIRNHFMTGIFALVVLTFLFIGCDERNKADLPVEAYKLRTTHSAAGIALWIDAQGDRAALAASAGGTFVLDVSNLSNITTVFNHLPAQGAQVTRCALDTLNRIVASCTDGTDGGDAFPIHNYISGVRVMGTAFSGPFTDYQVTSTQDSFIVWGSDRFGDGFVANRFVRSGDAWIQDIEFISPSYNSPNNTVRGFAINGNHIALACDFNGIHIHAINPPGTVSDLVTFGISQDCVWFGNYILVADQYSLTVVNAADPENLTVVERFVISGADRISRVKVDVEQELAILLDTNDGLYIVDISDPLNPELVQEIALPEPTSIDMDGNRLYVTDEAIGLLIYER